MQDFTQRDSGGRAFGAYGARAVGARRSFRRRALLACQIVRERDFKLVSSLAFDLSGGGMLVLSAERVLTGEPVLVSFRESGGRRFFDLEATVARVVHGRRPSDTFRALGLAFSPMREFERQRLLSGIKRLPLAA